MPVIPIYVSLFRLLVPFSILKWPLWGILAATLADMYDWKFVHVQTTSDLALYQSWDKALDLYYWLFALIVTFYWKDKLARKLAGFFLAYRILGMILFWVSQQRIFLLFFPNIFENLFIYYLLFVFFFKKTRLFTSSFITSLVLAILILPKLVHEYFLHFLEHQPWEIYDVGAYFGLNGFFAEYLNYLSWGGLLYILPFLVSLFYVHRLQTKH